MYQPECLRFCYTISRHTLHERVPSFRYTAITLLGLHATQARGLSVSFPVDEICADLATRAAAETELGSKALALWAALKMNSGAAGRALRSVLAHSGFVTTPDEGLIRSTELAWTVYGLALAWSDVNAPGGGALERNVKDEVKKRLDSGLGILRAQRNAATALFQCAGLPDGKVRLRDRLKATSGFFDSQVYGAMALAQCGKALDKPELLTEAHDTVRAILNRQGTHGEWPWHYDVRTGAIIDPYPIFSVHQDGMGPMVLLDVGERLEISFQEPVERSLAWIFGSNTIASSMIDHDRGLIWRGLRRKGPSQYVLQISRLLHYYEMPLLAKLVNAAPGLTIQYECRPYHLGWFLYAFCRPSQFCPPTSHETHSRSQAAPAA
jgi:hypothetical protein